MPIYNNEQPLYEYKPTGIIDKLVLKNNDPLDAWFGDTKLTAKDMGDYYAYSDGRHQWTYPKSKLEDTSNLNAQQRLERDWRKSSAYGFDKVMLGTLGLGVSPFVVMEAAPTLMGWANAASDAAMATRAGQAAYQGLTSPVGKAALSSVFGGMGMHNFFGDNGYAKTLQEWEKLKNDPNFYNAVNFGKSALGDAMDVTMMAPLYKPLTYMGREAWNAGKQGVENTWNWAAQQGNDYARARQLSRVFDNSVERTKLSTDGSSSMGKELSYVPTTTSVEEPSTSLIFYERGPARISEAEKAGVPKGERNNSGGVHSDNVYGNLRFIRNTGVLPSIDSEGNVQIGKDSNLLVNFTSDLPYRLHSFYPKIAGPHYLVVSPRAFKGKKFLSIQPDDSFLLNRDAVVPPSQVRVISGDTKVLEEAAKRGMRTTTSDKLQELYNLGTRVAQREYELGLNGGVRDFQNADYAADNLKWNNELQEEYPKEGIVVPYRREIDRIITEELGRPSIEDYKTLEEMTGLKSGVTTEFSPELLNNAKDALAIPEMFKHVYYNIATPIEYNIMNEAGLYSHPAASSNNRLSILYWLLRNKVNPIKYSDGGPLVQQANLFGDGGLATLYIKYPNENVPRPAFFRDWNSAATAAFNMRRNPNGGIPINILPEVTVKGYAPIKLRTYYPLGEDYPWTGHSELEIPISDKVATYNGIHPHAINPGETMFSTVLKVDKGGDSKDYNLITNNCSDATLDYLNTLYNKNHSPWFFTTPGDVRDFAIKELNGKRISEDGIDTVLIPRNASNADELSKKAMKKYFGKDYNDTTYQTFIPIKKAAGGPLSNTPLQEPLQPFNVETLMELGNKHGDKRTKEQEIKGSLPPYFSYDRDKDEYISDYWSDEADAPDLKWYRSKAAKELKKTHRQVIDPNGGRIKYVPIDVYKAGSWKARGLPNPLYEELGGSSSAYENPFEDEFITEDGRVALPEEGLTDMDGRQIYVTEDGQGYFKESDEFNPFIPSNNFKEGGSLNTTKQWNDLSLKERAEMMRVAIRNGVTNLSDIRDKYNEFALGGNIYAGGSVLKKMKEGLSNTTARVENQVVQNKLADKNFYEALPLLFAMDGVSIKVTSGYRPNSRVQESGKNTGRRSRHSYWGGAADIVAMGKSRFADIRRVLDNPNSNTSRWLRANGYGYLDETSATGTTKYWHDHTRDHSHYHIGMDYGKRYASMFRGSAQPTNSKWERRAEAYWAKAEPMYRELLNAGIDPVAAAGILGNIAQESGFNPNAANSVAGGHWGYLQNDRNITPWVRANYGGYDHKHQMDYLITGLQGRLPEKNMGLDKRFNGFNARMKGVTDPEMAAYLWEREYERSANENIPERKYFARYFYDRMMGNTPTSLAQNTPYQTNPSMGYQVSNPRAFYGNPEDYQQDYAKLFSQQEVSQPLVDAAFKYSEEEQRKAERQQQMANFRTLLGMTGAFGDDGLLGGMPLLTGGLFDNMGAYGGRLYGDGGEKEEYIRQDSVVPDALYVQRPVYDSSMIVPSIARKDALRRANHVYKNYSRAKDSPLSRVQEGVYNALRYLKDNVSDAIPAGISNCTLTATQWVNPMNPIKNASSIVGNPNLYGYEPITQEEAIPGDLLIAKVPNKDSYHTMLITGFTDNNGTYPFDGNNVVYKKGEPLLTYSRGGHDDSFIRSNVPLSVYTANSDGHTENLYYRYRYPNESFLPVVTVTGKR